MLYALIILMLATGYYTLTFGVSMIRDDKNKLGGIAAILFAIAGTVTPIVVLVMKQ